MPKKAKKSEGSYDAYRAQWERANLRQKATRQRRDGIASDVYRAVCDMEHMNNAFPGDPQLTFFTDFADDIAERRAADLLNRDKDDDQDEAA
jgi:hypothetical protein